MGKKTVISLLTAAIAAIALSFWFSSREQAIQGPSAIAVTGHTANASVWLSVDEELWHLSDEGHLMHRLHVRELGLKGRVGNIARHPDGRLLLGIRDVDSLAYFDPQLRRIVAHFQPQWPNDLLAHASRAISFAIGPSGEVAISTGGGHAVVLFDAEGRFVRRTPPGQYRFTNGLWWEGDQLWTTNTNAFKLMRLPTSSMVPVQVVDLSGNESARFLGMAVASTGHASISSVGAAPFATVVRFGSDMVMGEVVDVYPDGTQSTFNGSEWREPRDIAWLDRNLLMVDGRSFQVMRFNAGHEQLSDFGDAEVQGLLRRAMFQRAQAHHWRTVALMTAAACLLLGLILAARLQKKSKIAAVPATVKVMLAGTELQAAGWNQWRRIALLGAHVALIVAFWGGLILSMRWGSGVWFSLVQTLGAWTKGVVPLMLWVFYLFLRALSLRWLGKRPEWESVVNAGALKDLQRPDLADVLVPGEVVREALYLHRVLVSWLVLTNRSVLLFSANLFDRRLQSVIPLAEVVQVRLLHWPELGWLQRFGYLFRAATGMLEITTSSGKTVRGYVASDTTARRIHAVMRLHKWNTTASQPRKNDDRVEQEYGHWGWQMLASTLVPGAGQWMQRRRTMALWMFLWFAFALLVVTVPLIWAWWAPRADVSSSSIASAVKTHLFIAAVAAFDVWRMRRRM